MNARNVPSQKRAHCPRRTALCFDDQLRVGRTPARMRGGCRRAPREARPARGYDRHRLVRIAHGGLPTTKRRRSPAVRISGRHEVPGSHFVPVASQLGRFRISQESGKAEGSLGINSKNPTFPTFPLPVQTSEWTMMDRIIWPTNRVKCPSARAARSRSSTAQFPSEQAGLDSRLTARFAVPVTRE
jgi:hypothetical protein